MTDRCRHPKRARHFVLQVLKGEDWPRVACVCLICGVMRSFRLLRPRRGKPMARYQMHRAQPSVTPARK